VRDLHSAVDEMLDRLVARKQRVVSHHVLDELAFLVAQRRSPDYQRDAMRDALFERASVAAGHDLRP